MVVIISGVGGNELYVLYGQGGSELPSVTALVTIAIISVFIMFVLSYLKITLMSVVPMRGVRVLP